MSLARKTLTSSIASLQWLALVLVTSWALVVSGVTCEAIGGGYSFAFSDDEWVGGQPLGSQNLIPRLIDETWRCSLRISGSPCGTTIYRDERLSSISSDNSANSFVDLTGHMMSLSGIVVTEIAEGGGFAMISGDVVQWSVDGEKIFDESGTRSWALLQVDTSPYARWMPIRTYRFNAEVFAYHHAWVQVRHGQLLAAGNVPEPSTGVMLLIGFVILCFAGYHKYYTSFI